MPEQNWDVKEIKKTLYRSGTINKSIWNKKKDRWPDDLLQLFATIILLWNSLKCILWYLLVLSDPFIKNENSVLPILIEKNFEQKIYFCLLKMRSIFF